MTWPRHWSDLAGNGVFRVEGEIENTNTFDFVSEMRPRYCIDSDICLSANHSRLIIRET